MENTNVKIIFIIMLTIGIEIYTPYNCTNRSNKHLCRENVPDWQPERTPEETIYKPYSLSSATGIRELQTYGNYEPWRSLLSKKYI